jgi:hypothetical protein
LQKKLGQAEKQIDHLRSKEAKLQNRNELLANALSTSKEKVHELEKAAQVHRNARERLDKDIEALEKQARKKNIECRNLTSRYVLPFISTPTEGSAHFSVGSPIYKNSWNNPKIGARQILHLARLAALSLPLRWLPRPGLDLPGHYHAAHHFNEGCVRTAIVLPRTLVIPKSLVCQMWHRHLLLNDMPKLFVTLLCKVLGPSYNLLTFFHFLAPVAPQSLNYIPSLVTRN